MRQAKQNSKKTKPAPPKAASAQPGLSRTQVAWLAVILLATCAAYSPMLHATFINYDDDLYVTENPFVQELSAQNLKTLFSATWYSQYSPVAMLIMALEFKIFGPAPPALKAVSLLLHLANSLLVFLLIRQLFKRFDYAIVTAGFFALNTLQVESVAWLAASMKIGTYAFFFLASLLAYVHYLKEKKAGPFLVSWVFFVLSCFCKEQAIALPAALLAIDYFNGRPLLKRDVILEKIPFVAVSLVFAFVTLSLTGKMQNPQNFLHYSLIERVSFASFALANYLIKLLLPLQLSAFYTYPLEGFIPAYYYLSPAVAVLLLAALGFYYNKGNRVVVFGIVFFLANLFLTLLSQVLSVRDVMMADRYIYLPAIGYFLVLAFMLSEWIRTKPGLRTAIVVGMVVYAGLLAVLTRQRTRVWDHSIALFSNVIDRERSKSGRPNPQAALPYVNRGVARKRSGDRAGALADFDQAVRLNPEYAKPWLNRANLFFDAGEFKAAITNYDKALKCDEKNAKAYSNRGAAYAAQDRFDLALKDFNRAIELEPTMADGWGNRAVVHSTQKRFTEAARDADAYLRLKPRDPEMINVRALAYAGLNRLAEAETDFNLAIQLSPNTGGYYLNRAKFYHRTGRKAQALQDAQRAKALGAIVDPQWLNSLR